MRYDYDVDDKIKLMIWKAVLLIFISIVAAIIYTATIKPKDPKIRDDMIISAAESLCVFNKQLKVSNDRFDECMSKKQKIDDDSVIDCKKYGNSIAELSFSNVDGTISSSVLDDIKEAVQVSKQALNSGKQYIPSCSHEAAQDTLPQTTVLEKSIDHESALAK